MGSNASRGAGRERRSRRVEVRVSAAEYAALEVKAQAAGLTVSALLREHVGRVRVPERATGRALLVVLHRMHAHLRLLGAWALHYKGAAETAAVLAQVEALEAELTRALEAVAAE